MQPSELGAEYQQLLDSLPATETTVLSTARALEIRGEADRACALLEQARSRHPSANLSKSLAALHLKHGRYAKSAHVIAEVLDQQPRDVPSVLLLAEAQLKGGRHGEAAQTLRRAEQLGASKLRLFKLEQQLDEPTLDEQALDDATATIPTPSVGADTRPDPPARDDEATTQPKTPTPSSTPAPPPIPGDDEPSGSQIFEDGTFSNLTSLELADGAAALQSDDTPSIFDTLVDTYKDDPADRSFDDLLMDLGVPVDDEQVPDDPDATGAVPSRADPSRGDDEVAAEWGLDAPTAGPSDATGAIDLDRLRVHGNGANADGNATAEQPPPREETPRYHRSPRQRDATGAAEDDFADDRTEMVSLKLPEPGSKSSRTSPSDEGLPGEDVPDEDFPDEPPTRVEAPANRRKRRRTQQGYAAIAPRERPQKPPRAQTDDQAPPAQRPLPPSAGSKRTGERRQQRDEDPFAAGAQPPPMGRQPPAAAPATDHGTRLTRLLHDNVKWVAPTGVLLVLMLVGGFGYITASSAADAVAAPLAAYQEAIAPDTYQGYLAGERALDRALAAHSFMGASVDGLLGSMGLMSAAHAARAEARAERAWLSAMMEYRYEHDGTHGSRAAVEAAQKVLSGDPRVDVARAYRLMTTGRPDDAADILESTRKSFPKFTRATAALARAQLDAKNNQSASITATALREDDSLDVHQHFVLALVELQLGKDAADGRLQHILESLSPDHLSARIARSYSLRRAKGDDSKRAAALLDEVLGPRREKAAPMQLARAHIAMGDLYAAQESPARAEEQYRKAIKSLPERSSVYAPLIELYLSDGRLDKAVALIDDAVSQGIESPDLVLRRAEILRLIGRPQAAVNAIGEKELTGARGLWLEGLARLDLGQLDKAREAFSQAAEKNDEFAAARADRLMTDELASNDERDNVAEQLDRLVEKFPADPHVLRAAALAKLHVARVSKSRSARQQMLDQAQHLLDRAIDAGGNEAILRYDLCRQQMLAGDGRNASIQCRKARRLNARYLPGLLTTAELDLRRGRADTVLETLAEADDDFPDEPRISQYKALAYLDRYETKKAETEINRWAGTPAAKTTLHLLAEGRLAFTRKRYTSALGYFQRAHEQSPGDGRAALYYAQTLTRLGEHERAEKIMRPELTDLEWEPVAWLVFGEIRRRQQRFGDARENLGLALRKLREAIAPPWRTSQAYTQLALAWADRYGWRHRYVGRYLYRGAKYGDPDFPPLNAARGRYHLQRRRPDRRAAADAFEKVIEFEPFNCNALDALRDIYRELDEPDERERVGKLYDRSCED